MSEMIYRRSMGMTYDERALEVELSGGVSGYDTAAVSPYADSMIDDLSVRTGTNELNERAYVLSLAEAEVDAAELVFEHAKEQFEAAVSTEELAEGIELMTRRLTEDYDRRKTEGQPVGDEFYEEARGIAEAIAAANPGFDTERFSSAADALIELQYAERRLVIAEAELQVALAA